MGVIVASNHNVSTAINPVPRGGAEVGVKGGDRCGGEAEGGLPIQGPTASVPAPMITSVCINSSNSLSLSLSVPLPFPLSHPKDHHHHLHVAASEQRENQGNTSDTGGRRGSPGVSVEERDGSLYTCTPVDADGDADADGAERECSSQMVFLSKRATRSSSSLIRATSFSSSQRRSASVATAVRGGRRSLSCRDHDAVTDIDTDRDREGRFLSQGCYSAGVGVEYGVGCVLDGYIAAADSVVYSLMGVLRCDPEPTAVNTKKRKNTLNCGSDSRDLVTGSVGGLDLDLSLGRGREKEREVGQCPSPQTRIRRALEANHRVNGQLLELSRRYQEDLSL